MISSDDFNQLPIPYACIGADIETGLKVVLNKGSLARSIRANMDIPTVFTPVEIDGQLLK
jgi:NTE family protein